MKKTDEQVQWLSSLAATELRKHYAAQAKLSVNALLAAAVESTDPKVRGHVMAYMTWQAAHKELELGHEPD
jgi:hypothetical protein